MRVFDIESHMDDESGECLTVFKQIADNYKGGAFDLSIIEGSNAVKSRLEHVSQSIYEFDPSRFDY